MHAIHDKTQCTRLQHLLASKLIQKSLQLLYLMQKHDHAFLRNSSITPNLIILFHEGPTLVLIINNY